MESTISEFWEENALVIVTVLFFIFLLGVFAGIYIERNKKQEQKYLPGAYYLKKQAQPDPYPNFPGSVV